MRLKILGFAAVLVPALFAVRAAPAPAASGGAAAGVALSVADCVRDPSLDFWAAADNDYCRAVMADVFKSAGVVAKRMKFGRDGLADIDGADVICSAFRTPELVEKFDFPVQPIGRMHMALYTTASRAESMMSMKITDWPRLRVGYSPVSQGPCGDMQRYFEHAQLKPEYEEFKTSAGAVAALKKGDIDALFLYTPFGKRPDGVVEIVPIGSRNIYFAVSKKRPGLLQTLRKAYRECYIDNIDKYDALKEKLLGIDRPVERIRVAAYSRGDLFEVSPDGERTGSLEQWLKVLCGHTHWTLDYVYGEYDQCVEDVKSGRLDIIGGVSFAPSRREMFLYPHAPIGMLRVYLWTHHGNSYRPGEPSSWKGMKVGLLSGTVSSERVKKQIKDSKVDISCVEFESDRAMLDAYFSGEIDACVDIEMPELENECALHLYASYPMYICVSPKRKDIFRELEDALEEICDDFPKYLRMISEHHYGNHNDMAALSLKETTWLNNRIQEGTPVYVDFSPWPFPIFDKKNDGRPCGFIAALLEEISRRAGGLKILPLPQTGIQTAEAKFMRGDTQLWVPYPEKAGNAVYGAKSVFSLPVPMNAAKTLGCRDPYLEFEMFARQDTPEELISILRKVMAGIDQETVNEMFNAAMAERRIVQRVFGMTAEELLQDAAIVGGGVLLLAAIYGAVMIVLLKREVRRADAAAGAAERHAQAKTRFLAMMSHELRTPLNAVIGFGEFLARDDVDEDSRRKYTNGILLSSNALLELINDILDLSKLEAGAMEMRKGDCDFLALLAELPAIFGYRVQSHGVKLVIDAPPEMPHFALSRQGMRQILINLVGNSAKFTEQGEIKVAVSWDAASKTLDVSVSDTGMGMSKEKMAHLFDPFVQDIRSRMHTNAGETKGTGLGLPIVKRMVEAAGGTITAESTEGKGTVFKIKIAGLETIAPKQTAEDAKPAMPQHVPHDVLVVDDMVLNRKILGIHLKNIGVDTVRFAENGREALKAMVAWKPDIVLTDMWMPEMDGTELARAMRKDPSLAHIPVVAVTADVDVGSTYDMSLFAEVISKPVTGKKLHALFA